LGLQHPLRVRIAAVAALGTLISTITGLAWGASASGQTTPPGAPVTAKLRDSSLSYGEKVVATGQVAGGEGSPVALEYRPQGSPQWAAVAAGKAGKGGAFRLAVRLSRSGAVRVVAGDRGAAHAASAGGAPAAASVEQPVRVAARFATTRKKLNVRAGRTATIAGALRRPAAGRTVALELRKGQTWRTLDRAKTDPAGRFQLSYRTRASDSVPVRLAFSGDAQNAPTARPLGRLNAFRHSFASWYGPGFYGSRTACGQTFHAGIMGVAHRSLPCGASVTFRHRGRVVRARVVDRGPFAAGREFDLSPAVKEALGFGSTGRVEVAA
jgi:hypothetical protein